MLSKLFRFLALFAFLSVACFVVILFYEDNSTFTFLSRKYYLPNENRTFLWGFTKPEKGQKKEMEASNETSATAKSVAGGVTKVVPRTTTASEKRTLGTCPKTSPLLVGQLHVEFDFKRTWEEVRKTISPSLQSGGRYKPPDCVAQQKVAIIIPFRNRHEHLKHWLYYLHPILMRQQLDYGVYIINQDGEGIFNRAKLLNVGYVEALKEYDYDCFVFSDIDLVPLDDRNLYRCFENPRHLAVAMDKFNFNLPYNGYFGGVSSLSKQQFLKINGFPNTYWGWGGEDDDIYKRIYIRHMSVSRPDLITGRYKMVKHRRDLHNEPNPVNPDKLRRTSQTIDSDGINTLQYTVKEMVKDQLYTNITVDIQAPK